MVKSKILPKCRATMLLSLLIILLFTSPGQVFSQKYVFSGEDDEAFLKIQSNVNDTYEYTIVKGAEFEEFPESFLRYVKTRKSNHYWQVDFDSVTFEEDADISFDHMGPNLIVFNNCSGKGIDVSDPNGRQRSIYIAGCSLDVVHVNDSVSSLEIPSGKYRRLELEGTISSTSFYPRYHDTLTIDTLILWNVRFLPGQHRIETLPSEIHLVNVNLTELKEPIRIEPTNRSRPCNIYFGKVTGIDNLIFDYRANIKIHVYDSSNYDSLSYVYNNLLESFRRQGRLESFERLDKEFSSIKFARIPVIGGIADFIARNWWDYGYKKYLIVFNSLGLNFLFFLLNSFIFRRLLYETYTIKAFVPVSKEIDLRHFGLKFKRYFTSLPYVFLYTSYIFWGWKLDLSAVKVDKIHYFGIVLLEYLIGVICLAFLANFVLAG